MNMKPGQTREPAHSQTSAWLTALPDSSSGLPVFCFPYAGGGPTVFRDWQPHFKEEPLQLSSIALPGREKRLGEPSLESMEEIADTLFEVMAPYLDQPYIFVGLCFGGSIAYEVATRAMRHGLAPAGLVIIGDRAPHVPCADAIGNMDDVEFVAHLRRFGFVPEMVFDTPDLLELFMPMLRNDFSIDSRYILSGEKMIFPCPVTVLHGQDDISVTRKDAEAWQEYTVSEFIFKEFSGSQLFFTEQLEEVTNIIKTCAHSVV